MGLEVETIKTIPNQTLYQTDYQAWVKETAKHLRAGNFAGLDVEAFIEEVESLGHSERHALKFQWVRVIMHLLKLEAQPQAREYHNSWISSVVNGLGQIADALEDSPSLHGYLQENANKWYAQAVKEASVETRLPLPSQCPYDVLELITGNYPEALRYFFIIE
ncbi:DUF29 domain-containing protein [Thermosynechococcaceae cyanobacterium BACA0444]|uniref:DUF29 domain-containing protein n=1 Tax=Pseudocalidococcus azoricus BACA0444 TaxID=2918990 RepID=A0AAE4JYB3_9CYAN|nr:DUF29 domain-containing protein [Pseudocalidococcus azoricus BACA0444]